MRPILAIIPELPASLLLPLLGLTLLVALALAVRNLRLSQQPVAAGEAGAALPDGVATEPSGGDAFFAVLTPLVVAAGLSVFLFWWSRHDIKLHSYGFFLILGFMTAAWNACLEARRRGYDPNLILDMALPMLLVTIAMCRVLYVLLNLSQFHHPVEVLQVWSGGLSFHGIIPGSFMVIGYFAWTRKIGFWTLADLMAPSVFLGYFWGRLGCFFNGCCYGSVCDLPWAMQFPDEHQRMPGLPVPLTPPSHPAQLYAAAIGLLLFFFMQRAKLMPQFNRFPGQLSLLFLALYCVERAFVEIFRSGVTAKLVFGTTWLTQAQFASAVGLVAIAVVWMWLGARSRSAPASLHTQ
ncbi:MAG: prolipoprotein diacylglyceryl transferase [Armatimonadota bacterium]|nr:prolipoprotein diacylglyceryl transferase [Armatimonadota bacterium]